MSKISAELLQNCPAINEGRQTVVIFPEEILHRYFVVDFSPHAIDSSFPRSLSGVLFVVSALQVNACVSDQRTMCPTRTKKQRFHVNKTDEASETTLDMNTREAVSSVV